MKQNAHSSSSPLPARQPYKPRRLRGLARLTQLTQLAAGIGLALALPTAMAAPITIDWLSYAPTPINGVTPPATPGPYATGTPNNPYGPVSLSYGTGSLVTDVQTPSNILNGNVGSGSHNWGVAEIFGRTSSNANDPINQTWAVTYSFGTAMARGESLYLGIMGLGKRDANLGEANVGLATIVNVTENGDFTFLGEYDSSGLFAPTLSTITNNCASGSGPSNLRAENSLSAPGGLNPNWNTKWAVYRFDACAVVPSVNFTVNQTKGDGIGLNIGFANVPEPHSIALVASSLGLLALTRRRRSAAGSASGAHDKHSTGNGASS